MLLPRFELDAGLALRGPKGLILRHWKLVCNLRPESFEWRLFQFFNLKAQNVGWRA